MTSTPSTSSRGYWVTTAVLLLMVLAGIAAWHAPAGFNWLIVLAILTLVVVIVGHATTGRLLGILVNERKLMSLSRFQTVIWTLLVLSAYMVIAIARVKSDQVAEPLVIAIDWQIWALMGISTTALVGSPLVYRNKAMKKLKEDDKKRVFAMLEETYGEDEAKEPEKTHHGILYANADVKEARITDIFEGDELGNAPFIDMAKLQMFFFTVIVAIVYAVQLFRYISFNDLLATDASLPLLPEGFLVLLGVSTTGYLGGKAVDRTTSSG